MILTGNKVLITGGTSGIGLELARQFVELGNLVIVTGRNKAKLKKAADEISGLHTARADMAVYSDLQKLAHDTAHCNIVINNAAIQYNYLFNENNDAKEWLSEEIVINLQGPIALTQLMLPSLMGHKQAAIINVTSGLAITPKKTAAVYCATKAALHSFTKSLRYQLEGTDVKVFELMPPLVDTEMTQGRGRGKISPALLVSRFLKDMKNDRFFSKIGKVKILDVLHRISPSMAARIMKEA